MAKAKGLKERIQAIEREIQIGERGLQKQVASGADDILISAQHYELGKKILAYADLKLAQCRPSADQPPRVDFQDYKLIMSSLEEGTRNLKKAEGLNPGHFPDIKECIHSSYKYESSVFDIFFKMQMQKISTATTPQAQATLVEELQKAVTSRQVTIEKDFIASSQAAPNPTLSAEENAINHDIASMALKQISRSKLAETQSVQDHAAKIDEHEGALETISLMGKAAKVVIKGQTTTPASAQEKQSFQELRNELKQLKEPTRAELVKLLQEKHADLNNKIKSTQGLDEKLKLSKENIDTYKQLISVAYQHNKAAYDFSELHNHYATLHKKHQKLLFEKFESELSSETKLNLVTQIQKSAKTTELVYLKAAELCQDKAGKASYEQMSVSTKDKFQSWHDRFVKPLMANDDEEVAAVDGSIKQAPSQDSSEQWSGSAGGNHDPLSSQEQMKFESQMAGAVADDLD